MANGNQLPSGFVLDQPQQPAPPAGFTVDSASAPVEEPGMLDRAKTAFTGEDRMTPEMEALPEIGNAPEINAMSMPAFRTSLGLLTTGDTQSVKGIFTQQYGDQVKFREDDKGNTIVQFPSGEYALNKPGFSSQDLARGLFDVTAFTPAGAAKSVLGAVGKSMMTEAAIEGVESGVGGEFSPEEVVAAGALGGFFKGVEDLVGAGYRAIKGKPTGEAAEVIEEAARADIPVMTSDVRQPQTFAGKMAQQTTEKIPLIGTGGAREAQQEARLSAIENIAEKYGQFSYKAVVDSLKTQKDRVKKAAGSVLENVGNKLDDVGVIGTENTARAINDVSGELAKPGVIKSEQALGDLQVLSETLKEAPQTFTTLKENRTAFREIVKGADKAERTQLSSRAKSLLQSVERAMTKDMEKLAKENLSPQEFAKWKKANAVYAQESEKLTKTQLKNVLDKGDITPEAVETMLFSKKPSEVRSLYKSLTGEGRKNARAAVVSKVFDTLSKRAGGITPSTFASEMKKYGLQVGEFFKGQERRELNGLVKVLDATKRAQEASVTTPTGQQLLGAGTLAAAATDLAATLGIGGGVGVMARIYETPAVRQALIRLDSIPKGSTKFEQALGDAMSAIQRAAQTAREE